MPVFTSVPLLPVYRSWMSFFQGQSWLFDTPDRDDGKFVSFQKCYSLGFATTELVKR